eukprot:gene20572-21238_t
MPYLMQHEGDIFLCSSNGSIRAFTITGTGRNLTPNGTMWDHSRSVTQTICDLPTEANAIPSCDSLRDMPCIEQVRAKRMVCKAISATSSPAHKTGNQSKLTVWTVPQEGLDFQPAHTVKAHASAINKLVSTWRHCISISVRRIDICEWAGYRHLLIRPHVPRKIKCVHLYEDAVNGGMLAAGTSFGDVVVL